MADIIQAAKWMGEGKCVHRKSWHNPSVFMYSQPGGDDEVKFSHYDYFTPNDILANDWEEHGD